jgi:hypothetical protein
MGEGAAPRLLSHAPLSSTSAVSYSSREPPSTNPRPCHPGSRVRRCSHLPAPVMFTGRICLPPPPRAAREEHPLPVQGRNFDGSPEDGDHQRTLAASNAGVCGSHAPPQPQSSFSRHRFLYEGRLLPDDQRPMKPLRISHPRETQPKHSYPARSRWGNFSPCNPFAPSPPSFVFTPCSRTLNARSSVGPKLSATHPSVSQSICRTAVDPASHKQTTPTSR